MPKKEEKTETEEQKPITDQEAEAAFIEGAGDDTPPEKTGISDEADDEKPTGDEKTGDDTPGGDKTGKKPTYEALEKALSDTKTWATSLSEKVKALETGKAAPAKEIKETPPAADTPPENVKSFYKDYPEAKEAILYEAEQLAKKRFGALDPTEVKKTISNLESTISQTNFERSVVVGVMGENGDWIPGHSDAYQVLASSGYKNWFENEIKVNPTLGQINDPARAIDLLTRYKKETASAAATAHDKKTDAKVRDLEDMAAAAPEGGTQTIDKKPKGDDDRTPEELFAQGANS